MFNFGFIEIAVILGLGLVILGPKRLPDALRVVGKAFRDFRRSTHDIRETWEEATSDSDPVKKVSPTSDSSDHSS